MKEMQVEKKVIVFAFVFKSDDWLWGKGNLSELVLLGDVIEPDFMKAGFERGAVNLEILAEFVERCVIVSKTCVYDAQKHYGVSGELKHFYYFRF